MKRLLIAGLVAAGLTAPAMAQFDDGDRYNGYGHAYDYGRSWDREDRNRHTDYRDACENNRAKRAYWQIRRGVQTNEISWQRARDLRAAVDRTAWMQRNFCARGLNDYQAERLDRQWDRVEDMVRSET